MGEKPKRTPSLEEGSFITTTTLMQDNGDLNSLKSH
jgi:hypothetical protein